MNIEEMTTEEIIAHLQTRFVAIIFAGTRDDKVVNSNLDEIAIGYAGDIEDVMLLIGMTAERVEEDMR